MKTKKIVSILLALLFVSCSILLASCATATENKNDSYSLGATDYYYETTSANRYGYEAPWYEMNDAAEYEKYLSTTAANDGVVSPAETRKIIKNVSLTLQTLEFLSTVSEIEQLVKQTNGYIEYSDVSGSNAPRYTNVIERYANFTLRIPADNLEIFISSVSKNVNVLSKKENSSDITESYYDIQAKIDSLLLQEERLIAILVDATELQYMLEVERELANVRYQIETYYSQIKRYDSNVAMSTVTIYLQEVVEYEEITEAPKSFGERVKTALQQTWNSFVKGSENFFINLIYILPALIIIIVIAAVVIIAVSLSIRRKKHAAKLLVEKDDKSEKDDSKK